MAVRENRLHSVAMSRDQELVFTSIEVLAFSAGILSIVLVMDINPSGSGMWWGSVGLVMGGLWGINYRHRRMCARLNQINEERATLGGSGTGEL